MRREDGDTETKGQRKSRDGQKLWSTEQEGIVTPPQQHQDTFRYIGDK